MEDIEEKRRDEERSVIAMQVNKFRRAQTKKPKDEEKKNFAALDS